MSPATACFRSLFLALFVALTGCANHEALRDVSIQAANADPQVAEVLMLALDQIGTPYRFGGTKPETGFDCSGLIGYAYLNAAGVKLPRTTRDMYRQLGLKIKRSALTPGDLVFFSIRRNGRIDHAGIYMGDGRFIHAPSSGGSVRLDQLSQSYWNGRYLGAKRVLKSGE